MEDLDISCPSGRVRLLFIREEAITDILVDGCIGAVLNRVLCILRLEVTI